MRNPMLLALLGGLLAAAPVLAKDKQPMADEFTGTLISMDAPGAMGSRVSIWVETYTTDDVADSLVKTLTERGQKGLLDAVTDLRVGTIRIGTGNGYPISVARQRTEPDGSRTVFLATSRPFVGFSATAGTRIDDYPFGIIELKIPADGAGEGTLVGAAQVAYEPEKKNLSVHSYATHPSRLSNVKAAKPKN